MTRYKKPSAHVNNIANFVLIEKSQQLYMSSVSEKSVTNINISCLDSKPVRMSSTRSAFGARVLSISGGHSSFIGVSSYTGPIMKEELQAVMLGGELGLWGSSLAPVPSQ